MKKFYLGIMSDDDRDRESILPQQYLTVCRTLSSGKLLVLASAYRISKTPQAKQGRRADSWLSKVAVETGMKHSSLVEVHERQLIQKLLITPRGGRQDTLVTIGEHFGITDLGVAICDFISKCEIASDNHIDG